MLTYHFCPLSNPVKPGQYNIMPSIMVGKGTYNCAKIDISLQILAVCRERKRPGAAERQILLPTLYIFPTSFLRSIPTEEERTCTESGTNEVRRGYEEGTSVVKCTDD